MRCMVLSGGPVHLLLTVSIICIGTFMIRSPVFFFIMETLSVSGQRTDLLYDIRPDENCHLGAQSHVRVSFDMPEYSGDVIGLGTLRVLEAIRKTGIQIRVTRLHQVRCSGQHPTSERTDTV